MYLFWGHSASREGEWTKKATQNDTERRAWNQKGDVLHKSFYALFSVTQSLLILGFL